MIPSTHFSACRFGAVLTYQPPGPPLGFSHNGQEYFTTGPEREALRQAYAKVHRLEDLIRRNSQGYLDSRIKSYYPSAWAIGEEELNKAWKELEELQARLAAQAGNKAFSVTISIPRRSNRTPEAMTQLLELMELMESPLPTAGLNQNADAGNPIQQKARQ